MLPFGMTISAFVMSVLSEKQNVYNGYISISTDSEECGDLNGGCEVTCENLPGSYQCSCDNGWILEADEHNCSGKALGFPHTSKNLPQCND